MSREPGGLELFGSEVHADLLREILGWENDPELGRIIANLRSHTSRKAFLDTWAEAMVARWLRGRGCELRFELPTPAGRRSDFQVRKDGIEFFLHVKRAEGEQPVRNPRRLAQISSRLRLLERIARPYVVQVRWNERMNAENAHRLVAQAEEFILRARVGDEMRARDHDGREIGGARILAPWAGTHVNVTIGLPSGFIDLAPRFRRLMHRAHQQFMPKSLNVIAICSGHESELADFETALLGSHIERWDAFPPRGRRIAHGRAPDGFWHGQRFGDSRYACWFCLPPASDAMSGRLWVREGTDPGEKEALPVTGQLARIFNS